MSNQDKIKELMERRQQAIDEISQLEKIVREAEEEIATLACPWKKDTVIRVRGTNTLYVVDDVYFQEGFLGNWRVAATRVRKDLSFGASRMFINERDASTKYIVERGFTVTDEGIVPIHKTRPMF